MRNRVALFPSRGSNRADNADKRFILMSLIRGRRDTRVDYNCLRARYRLSLDLQREYICVVYVPSIHS